MRYIVPIVITVAQRNGQPLTFRNPLGRELFGPICTRVESINDGDTHMVCIAQEAPGGPAVIASGHDELVALPGVTFVED